jgi:hypothetical protein
LANENTFGFNESEYIEIVTLLNQLNSDSNFNFHWFAGHYHLKNMNWTDTDIDPDTFIKVIASANPLSLKKILDNYPGVSMDPTIMVNNVYSINVQDNPNGQITVVKALSPRGTDPDPSIYSEDDPDAPLPTARDNPDIELYRDGVFVPSCKINYGDICEIRAKIYNKGGSDADINLSFTWSDETLNHVDQVNGFAGGDGQNSNIITGITIPSGKEMVVPGVRWNTSVVSPCLGSNSTQAYVSAIIEPINTDSNLANDRGQENVIIDCPIYLSK